MADEIPDRALKSSSTPETPAVDPERLRTAVEKLAVEFQLTDDQTAALPTLEDITLTPQNDSDLIANIAGVRPAHPFKLFIGEMEWKMRGKKTYKPAYVYMFTNRPSQPKLEICNPNADWAPREAMYYNTVQDLAYPFNEWSGSPRFIAAVKYYFLLGWQAGLYNEKPAYNITGSWMTHLQGACDDLIKANGEMEVENHRTKEVKQVTESIRPSQKRIQSLAQLVRSPTSNSGAAAPKSPPIARRKAKEPAARSHSHPREEQAGFHPHLPSYSIGQFPHGLPAAFPVYGAPLPFPMYGASGPHYMFPSLPQGHQHMTHTPAQTPSSDPKHQERSLSRSRTRAHSDKSKTPIHRSASAIPEQQRHPIPLRKRNLSSVPRLSSSALEDEYVELYRQRDKVQTRMHDIRKTLSEEEYGALVIRIEGSPVAALDR